MFNLEHGHSLDDHKKAIARLPKLIFEAPEQGQVNTYNRVNLGMVNDQETWVDLAVTELFWNGQLASQIIIADVTHNILAEQSLSSAKTRAEGLAEAKTQFLATMSHEIRSPMNGILTMSDLLAQSNLDTEQTNMTGVINRSAKALLSIINDILDFSKIEAGKLDIESTEFNLPVLIGEVADLLAPKFADKGLEFILDVGLDIPSQLIGDPNRLRQILINLIGNAEKFTERGYVLLKVNETASISGDTTNISFEIIDTGIGINDAIQPRLFSPFEQAETSTARRFGGSGLGLSICKHLTELQGGTIGVTSTEGLGSNFHFNLPFKIVEASNHTPLASLHNCHIIMQSKSENTHLWKSWIEKAGGNAFVAQRHDDIAKLTQNETILLLDFDQLSDDEVLRTLVKRTVKQTGCKIALMTSAGQTVETIKQHITIDGHQNKPAQAHTLVQMLADIKGGKALAAKKKIEQKQFRFEQPSTKDALSHGCLILVVEDNPVNQIVIQKTMKHLGFAFDMASNGKEALDKVNETHYGLILSDLHMPVMDGMTFTIALRAMDNKRKQSIPVIALTADILQETKEKCRIIGMNNFLSKPIDMEELEAMVCEWLPAADQLRRVEVNTHMTETSEPIKSATNSSIPNIVQTPDHLLDISRLFDSSRIDFIFESDPEEGNILVTKFIQTLSEKLAETQASLQKDDITEARNAAHAAKGAAGSVGALTIYNAFKAAEEDIIDGDLSEAIKELATVPSQIADFKRAVELTYSLTLPAQK